MRVPFVDLIKQYHNIKSEIDQAIQDVLENAAFIGGPGVKAFEDSFAHMHKAKFCIGTSSGTDSIHLILWSLGLRPGHEVIVPVNTFIATAEAVSLTGAKPIFVDHDPQSFNIDISKIQDAINENTKAIIPVHLYGQPADMDSIMDIAKKHDLMVVEDCCQAHLAEYNHQKVGTFGRAGAFSFFCAKNLGAFGEGGAVVTNDEDLYNQMRQRHNHGTLQRYIHGLAGHNYRLEGIQAAVLNVKMKYIEKWTKLRHRNADFYRKFLANIPEINLPEEIPGAKHVYHLFVIRARNRDDLREYLEEREVSSGLHYPVPLHLQEAYSQLGYKQGDFPIAESYAEEILSLPMFPELTVEQIAYVSDIIREFYQK
ncbi:aminotransferase class I/II-fold pyridoxal phosphate-dependent enzyme [Candidatus Poribacteria bacterium]|nr:aminotransferase class I/II-fold pyridoxal phosphate-dependent enzyme [Candidatus Poribacteria bacterium]